MFNDDSLHSTSSERSRYNKFRGRRSHDLLSEMKDDEDQYCLKNMRTQSRIRWWSGESEKGYLRRSADRFPRPN